MELSYLLREVKNHKFYRKFIIMELYYFQNHRTKYLGFNLELSKSNSDVYKFYIPNIQALQKPKSSEIRFMIIRFAALFPEKSKIEKINYPQLIEIVESEAQIEEFLCWKTLSDALQEYSLTYLTHSNPYLRKLAKWSFINRTISL